MLLIVDGPLVLLCSDEWLARMLPSSLLVVQRSCLGCVTSDLEIMEHCCFGHADIGCPESRLPCRAPGVQQQKCLLFC